MYCAVSGFSVFIGQLGEERRKEKGWMDGDGRGGEGGSGVEVRVERNVLMLIRGIIDTEMHRESVRIRGKEGDYKIQIPRKGRPEEVAALITWLLCDGSQYITGTVQIIDGGIMA